jgi:hypothetical protein
VTFLPVSLLSGIAVPTLISNLEDCVAEYQLHCFAQSGNAFKGALLSPAPAQI